MVGKNSAIILAMYYKEPLKNNDGIPNPRVTAAAQWIDDYFRTPARAEEFCNHVMRSFEPSATVPYPTLAHFEKIYREHNMFQPTPFNPPTMAQIADAFGEANQIRRNPPKELLDVTIGDILEDSEKLSPSKMMERYGMAYASTAWYIEERYRMGDEYDPTITIPEYRKQHAVLPLEVEV